MAAYFNLAHGVKVLEDAGNFKWPYDIDVCFESVPHPIAFSQGVGHGAAGCAISARDALEPKWRQYFEMTQGEWLIPYIERLASGVPLPSDEMIAQFVSRHGKQPESYDSKFS